MRRLAPKIFPGETVDSICGGSVKVIQSRRGYRFNLDPILLAHFAPRPVGPAIDLGTGAGIIPLVLCRKLGWKEVTGLEIQSQLYDLAQRNVHLNRCESSVSLVLGDLRDAPQLFQARSFAHVLANPPYRAFGAGLTSHAKEKAIAKHELLCSLSDVTSAASYLLREGGTFSIVFPSGRLTGLLCALQGVRLRPKLMRMVHPRSSASAKLVLIEAIKGGRGQLEARPPLFLHRPSQRGQAFADEVFSMLGP